MIVALLIAFLVAIVVSVAFRHFAPEYAAPAAVVAFVLTLLYYMGALR